MRGEMSVDYATPVTKFVHIHDLTASDCLHTVQPRDSVSFVASGYAGGSRGANLCLSVRLWLETKDLTSSYLKKRIH